MITLTKDAVLLYDIEIGRVWERMSHLKAEEHLATCRELGDTIQEYDTTDRTGRPVRVALQIGNGYDGHPDMGGVYVFTR